jgi:hypothetical protein
MGMKSTPDHEAAGSRGGEGKTGVGAGLFVFFWAQVIFI